MSYSIDCESMAFMYRSVRISKSKKFYFYELQQTVPAI